MTYLRYRLLVWLAPRLFGARTFRTLVLALCIGLLPTAMYAQPAADADSEGRIVAAADLALAAPAAPAPVAQPEGPRETPEHTGIKALFEDVWDDIKHLPSKPNAWIATLGGAAALASHPADDHVTSDLVNASWAHNTFAFGAVLGDTTTLLGTSIGVYAVGRAKGYGKISHMGMDMLQSLMVSELMVETLKYTTRRERPDGSGANGFPSGHAADTFAMATALERHFGWKGAVPAYAFASYVAASRLHDNRHYLSDVVFGSAVGIIAGRTVTRHGREIPVTIAAVPGGAAIVYIRGGQ